MVHTSYERNDVTEVRVPKLTMPAAGDDAPSISASTATSEKFELLDKRGSWVVVYFFPRSNTPG